MSIESKQRFIADHGHACGEQLEEPHPDFPDSSFIVVIHNCAEEKGHDGKHFCRKDHCWRSWGEDDTVSSPADE